MNLSDLNKLLVDSENNENEKEKEKEFQELNIPEEVINSLKQINIVYPSPIQYITIKEAIQKQDLIIQSKNGTGKSTSICIILISHIIKRIHKNVAKNKFKSFLNNNKDDNYCGSAINEDIEKDNYCEDAFSFFLYFYGIVLVPTRELCVQINDVINKISENLIIKKNKQLDTTNEFVEENVIDKYVKNNYILKITSIILYGGTDVYDNIKNLFLTLPQIVISTPGRLKHVLKMFQNTNIELDNINLFQKIDSKKIKISYLKIVNLLLKKLIIDEVDALLDEQFEDQMKIIFNLLINPSVQILAYSSTFRESTIDIFKKMVTSIDISYINKMKNLYNQSSKLIKDHHASVTNDPVLASEENAKNGPKNGPKNWMKNWMKNCESALTNCAGVEIDNSPSKQNLDAKVCESRLCDKVCGSSLLTKQCIKTAIKKKKKKKKKKKM